MLFAATAVGADVTDADIAECRRVPQVKCLADLGFELAMKAPSYPEVFLAPHLLGQIGRYSQAHALSVRSQTLRDMPRERAIVNIDFLLREYQIIDGLLSGLPPEGDLGFHALTAASLLLDQIMIGAALNARLTKDPQRIAAARLLAEKMALSTRIHQIEAARIFMETGESERARFILLNLVDDDSPRVKLSDDLVRLIGTEKSLQIYRAMGDVPSGFLASLALIEPESDKQVVYLQEMLASAQATEEIEWRLLGLQHSAVTAMKAGHEEMARNITEDLGQAAEQKGSMTAYLSVLGAQDAIGASEAQQRETLKRGLHARSEGECDIRLATHTLRLVGVDEAIHLFDLCPDVSILDWTLLVCSQMSNHIRRDLFAAVRNRLDPDDFAILRANAAAELSGSGYALDDQEYAREIARRLLKEQPPFKENNGQLIGNLYDKILKTAERLEDENMIDEALLQSAHRALDDRDYRLLLQAAHQYDHMAQR